MTNPVATAWRPTVEHLSDAVTASAAAGLHGLLDAPGDPPATGEPLPALWHWLAFLPRARQSELGADGHPKRGGFLPDVDLARRMFVGGRVQFLQTVHVGQTLQRHGTVTRVETKSGRSGQLVFVTVRYEISGGSGPSIVEEQDIVYRDRPAQNSAPIPEIAQNEQPAWQWDLDVDVSPTFLFRFSALTYNAHRIHYDRDWATSQEGYPGLVVHGPLQAIGMAELCRRHLPARTLRHLEFRSVRPAFDDGPLQFKGTTDKTGDLITLATLDSHGQVTTTGTAA